MPTSNAIDWQIESIRGTAFVDGQLNPAMLETWIGEVSENSPSKVNKTSSSFVGISRSSLGFLRTNWNADRLDVILSSEEPKQGQPIAPISDISSLFERFVDRIPEIGELVPVDRIALGLVLVFQVPSEAKGLEILLPSMLSGINLPSSARDFLYRVNFPCESQIHSGLRLNRLATWSVSKTQVIHIQINQDGSQVQQTISESPFAVRLELDINTDNEVRLGADSSKLLALLKEMEIIAVDIAKGGEATMRA
jgi:hypothetical protein